ncbi:MAG: hypothetical protein AB7I48_23795 [Planctomycetaceae bacterium]
MPTPTTRTPVRQRFRLLIRTTVGWSASRERFRTRRAARESALWFLSLSGVDQVRIVNRRTDAVTEILDSPRRKPR